MAAKLTLRLHLSSRTFLSPACLSQVRGSVMDVPLTVAQAIEGRDAMAKDLYVNREEEIRESLCATCCVLCAVCRLQFVCVRCVVCYVLWCTMCGVA